MKKFKIGAEIKTKEEAKELVLNLISGVEDEFMASWLKELTFKYLSGSPIRSTFQDVDIMVDLILYDLQMENKIVCDKGIFVKVKNKEASL